MAEGSRLDKHFMGGDGTDAGETSQSVDDHDAAQALPQRPRSRNPGRNAGGEESRGGQETNAGGTETRYGPGFPWPGGGESGVASGSFRPLTSAGR